MQLDNEESRLLTKFLGEVTKGTRIKGWPEYDECWFEFIFYENSLLFFKSSFKLELYTYKGRSDYYLPIAHFVKEGRWQEVYDATIAALSLGLIHTARIEANTNKKKARGLLKQVKRLHEPAGIVRGFTLKDAKTRLASWL